ncbi:hypothetical protein DK873_02685 [Lactobacillus melliventris]|uniref:YopX protein domain-containing protein n=2 Tax=Lactobacillus melliventris TaxID=1218507 RepID=A0ABX5MZY1_9LACO|nr:hypothetical protein DK873_02685 [Lactobacillus melliventris]
MEDIFKFRKWNKETKTMSQVEVLDLRSGQTYIDDPIIMQYTGLKDANGKDIYEGDILCVPTHYRIIMSAVDHWVDEFLEVKYSSLLGGFIVLPFEKYLSKYLFDGYDKNGFYHKYPKIVGNIYQNSNLIRRNNDK